MFSTHRTTATLAHVNFYSENHGDDKATGIALKMVMNLSHGVLDMFRPKLAETLLDYWMKQLVRAEREALRVLCDAHPRALTKQQIANGAGYEVGGGGFRNALSRLRTLELIKGMREMKANPAFFE